MKKVTFIILILVILIGGVYMAHDKVYVVCENMCMEEGLTKAQIEGKFATIPSIQLSPSDELQWSFNSFGDDWNANNTVPVAILISSVATPTSNDGWKDGTGVVSVKVLNDKITVTNISSDTTVYVKAVLMKVN